MCKQPTSCLVMPMVRVCIINVTCNAMPQLKHQHIMQHARVYLCLLHWLTTLRLPRLINSLHSNDSSRHSFIQPAGHERDVMLTLQLHSVQPHLHHHIMTTTTAPPLINYQHVLLPSKPACHNQAFNLHSRYSRCWTHIVHFHGLLIANCMATAQPHTIQHIYLQVLPLLNSNFMKTQFTPHKLPRSLEPLDARPMHIHDLFAHELAAPQNASRGRASASTSRSSLQMILPRPRGCNEASNWGCGAGGAHEGTSLSSI